jgi:hypothetical protein
MRTEYKWRQYHACPQHGDEWQYTKYTYIDAFDDRPVEECIAFLFKHSNIGWVYISEKESIELPEEDRMNSKHYRKAASLEAGKVAVAILYK